MIRASDELRESTVAQLGDGYARGMLGIDTLCHRVDRAYAARSREQLLALVRDLPASSASTLRGLWDRIAARFDDRPGLFPSALLTPPISHGASRYLLGRGEDCELRVEVSTVSRRHARLEHDGEKWTIEDLGSFNGTFVNGWRVRGIAELQPGDSVQVADVTWVFAPHR